MPDDYEPIIVEDVKRVFLYERMKYQDFPMVIILIIHLISHIATGKIDVIHMDGK